MKSFSNRTIAGLTKFVRTYHGYIAAGLLLAMGLLAGGSMVGNSAIVDEVAHIPAGYSYLHFSDYRLNPEHPPLIKDLAGLPLQFLNLKFPVNLPAWKSDVNGQWETGWNFIYHIGNDADQILFWARLPILLLALAFGAGMYYLVRRRWGTAVGLLALFFYAFSPNFLAHSALVTTDLGASISMFLVIFAFVNYAEKPAGRSFLWLSLALAFAQLVKFSAILLFPYLGLVAVALVILMKRGNWIERTKLYVVGLIAASALSVAWVWAYYTTQVMSMPESVQDALIRGSLPDRLQSASNLLTSINHLPLAKSLVQYLLGLTMVFNRVSSGNVTYFNGQVTNQSFHAYFPELFVLKTQIALLVLGLALIVLTFAHMAWRRRQPWIIRFMDHLRGHLMEWTLGGFAAFYFAVSVVGNLNLGIRHILPIYIPIFVVVAVATMTWLRRESHTRWAFRSAAAVALLMVWYGLSTVTTYPNFLSYFNEAIGGQGNSGKYFSDSSVDWGQDLKRLVSYTKAHPEIKHIAVDYFGGGVPEYYFCNRLLDDANNLVATSEGYDCSHSIYEPWHSKFGRYSGQYIAVSETFLENDRYYSSLDHVEGYAYLRSKTPIAEIGNSIYVYKLK